MQNIQDVENSKKIISKQDLSENLSNLDSGFDISGDENSRRNENDVQNQEMSMKNFDHQDQDSELNMILLVVLTLFLW
jgi:hypothetical protein